MSQRQKESRFDRTLKAVALLAVVALVLLLVATNVLRLVNLTAATQSSAAQAGATAEDRANEALERANDAVTSVELVLSFLEGASVLLGLGFGAAAFYGFRSSREGREELAAEVARIEKIREQIEGQLNQLEGFRPYLENLADLQNTLETSRKSLEETIGDVARLLQADQEFRLKNFDTAYAFARQVLEHDPNNPMALYIAGWLEVRHRRDQLDQGIEHLRRAVDLEPHWPTARAAYGIGIRRKARDARGEDRERLFLEAEGALKKALADSPRLMDFEGESLWGPVGGILRELGQFDGAIHAYESALRVTPGSSYPWGNLATLYLRKARENSDDPAWQERALAAFQQTREAARAEMGFKPSDYFLLMDVAQASMMLGRQDPASFTTAHHTLDNALNIKVSLNTLETSQRGWQDLRANCPQEWSDVITNLDRAIETMAQAIRRESEATSTHPIFIGPSGDGGS